MLRRVPPGQKQDLGAVRVDGRDGFPPKVFECKQVGVEISASADARVVPAHARHTLCDAVPQLLLVTKSLSPLIVLYFFWR